jgi:hypothetical protein
VRKPTSFRFASSNSAIRVFKSSKRPGLTASSITQYTFSFIKSFLKKKAALQETATKAMQTARLETLLRKQQETRSPSFDPLAPVRPQFFDRDAVREAGSAR